MLSEVQKGEAIDRFKKIESIVLAVKGEQPDLSAQSQDLLASRDSLEPVLRTALAINWKESSMRKRYDSFRTNFPEIDNLSSLKHCLETTSALEFCRTHLGINANPQKPQDNPKYKLLVTLTNAFLSYKERLGVGSEIEAIRHWADRVDLSNLKSDPIGTLHGVGPGTVENIRLNLGMPVVKPDRHVIDMVRHVLHVKIKQHEYTQLAKTLELEPRYFDYIFFEYGKIASSQ